MVSSSEPCGDCGHRFEAHTDRAIYPPCEGAWWPGPPRSDQTIMAPGVMWRDRIAWIRENACFCKAYRP